MQATPPASAPGSDGAAESAADRPLGISSSLYTPKPGGARVPAGTVVAIVLIVFGLALGAYLVYRVLPVLLVVFIAIMLGTAIEPLVNKLRRGPFSRSQGILIVYTIIFAVLVTIAWLIIPPFVSQVGEVVANLKPTIAGFHDWAGDPHNISNPFLRLQVQNVADALNTVFAGTKATSTTSPDSVVTVGQVVLSLATGLLTLVAIFVIAFYWMTERTHIKRWAVSLLPADRANRVRRVWDEIEVKVGGWVRGQLTLMSLIGLISLVGYFLIGVKYWPALALFIALAEAIPLVGPYIGTAPAVVIALTQGQNDGLLAFLNMGDLSGLTRALLVVVFAVLLQTVEGNVLVPRVMRSSVGISPLTVIISLLLGAELAGLAGALLAVPVAGSIQVIVADLQTRAVARAEEEHRQVAEQARRAAAAQIILPGTQEAREAEETARRLIASQATAEVKPAGPAP